MKKFRVKVDLSVFFDDERKLVHILVDPAWESVKNLQTRVEHIFELENIRFITNEGCFVPPQEPIRVIKPGDVLRAFIPAGDMIKKKKKVKPQKDVAVNDEEKVKKRKREMVKKDSGFSSSTPNHAKRSKSTLPLTVAIKNNTVDEITSTSEQLGLKYEKQKQSNNNLGANVEELQTSAIVNDASCQKVSAVLLPERSDKVEKKRGRKKKNKINKSLIKINETMDRSEKSNLGAEDAAPDQQSSSNKLILSTVSASKLQNESKQMLSQLGHSYFNDAGETVSTTTENGTIDIPAKVIFRCPVSEVSYDKPRVFSLKKINPDTPETKNDHTTPAIKETQSDIVLEPPRIKSKSPVIIEELVIIPSLGSTIDNNLNKESSNVNKTDIDQTEKNMNTTAEQSEQETTIAADDSSVIAIESEYDEDSEEENDKNDSNGQDGDVSEIIDLNASDDESEQSTIIVGAGDQPAEVPGQKMSIDEMLPFSIVLEALPVPNETIIFKLHRVDSKMSGYIAGKCEYINKRTKTIKIVVIDGQKEIAKIPNKFICALDDSTDTDKQYLQLKYNDLLDAKLFSVN